MMVSMRISKKLLTQYLTVLQHSAILGPRIVLAQGGPPATHPAPAPANYDLKINKQTSFRICAYVHAHISEAAEGCLASRAGSSLSGHERCRRPRDSEG